MPQYRNITVTIFISLAAYGCAKPLPLPPPAPVAIIPSRSQEVQRLTLGAVQSQVVVGTSSGEVVTFLGPPNIVTSNKDSTETWVYDKVFSESETVTGRDGVVSVSARRTLVVSIKFDSQKRVEKIQYRQMSF